MSAEPNHLVTVINISYPLFISRGPTKFILMLLNWLSKTEREYKILLIWMLCSYFACNLYRKEYMNCWGLSAFEIRSSFLIILYNIYQSQNVLEYHRPSRTVFAIKYYILEWLNDFLWIIICLWVLLYSFVWL